MLAAVLLFLRPKTILVAAVITGLFALAVASPLAFVLVCMAAALYFVNKVVEALLRAVKVKHARAFAALLVTVGMIALAVLLPTVTRLP